MATQITRNFTLEELTKTHENIPNIPEFNHVINLTHLAFYVLQPLRDFLKEPIIINSGYRNKEVNFAVHGSENSQHLQGQAADFKCKNMTLAHLYIKNYLFYDQLIVYKLANDKIVWIHVSFDLFSKNRKECITKHV